MPGTHAPLPVVRAVLAPSSTLKDWAPPSRPVEPAYGLGTRALLPHSNRLGSLALKQPPAQFHAFLLERLCTVCPCGHGDEASRHASCPEWQATGVPGPTPPPTSQHVKTPNSNGGVIGALLMSHVGARSWLMSKGMWQGGWSRVRAMEG